MFAPFIVLSGAHVLTRFRSDSLFPSLSSIFRLDSSIDPLRRSGSPSAPISVSSPSLLVFSRVLSNRSLIFSRVDALSLGIAVPRAGLWSEGVEDPHPSHLCSHHSTSVHFVFSRYFADGHVAAFASVAEGLSAIWAMSSEDFGKVSRFCARRGDVADSLRKIVRSYRETIEISPLLGYPVLDLLRLTLWTLLCFLMSP